MDLSSDLPDTADPKAFGTFQDQDDKVQDSIGFHIQNNKIKDSMSLFWPKLYTQWV